MTIFFDGHNDSLTREDHARFASGRDGGQLDLPRMAEAGMRGGIFAVFIRNPETADYRPARSNRPGGAGPAPQLDHAYASAASTTLSASTSSPCAVAPLTPIAPTRTASRKTGTPPRPRK